MSESKTDLQSLDRFLILMRHAKSDWSDESLSDHERPLNARGKRDAPRMANWLTKIEMVPDVVLSSDSQRTRDTCALMSEQWQQQPTVLFSESLYLAGPDEICRAVRSDAWDAKRLMVIAHNPGMAYLVSGLADELIDMPTAAIAVFQVDEDFSQLRPGSPIQLMHYMRPKAL